MYGHKSLRDISPETLRVTEWKENRCPIELPQNVNIKHKSNFAEIMLFMLTVQRCNKYTMFITLSLLLSLFNI